MPRTHARARAAEEDDDDEPPCKKPRAPAVSTLGPQYPRSAFENNRRLYELRAQVLRKHAPRVKELTMQMLETIKELTALNEEAEKECPSVSYGDFGYWETAFNGLKAKAEKHMQ
jgi:hypothetical protein